MTQGETIEDVLKTMTVEGVPTAVVAVEFADKCGLDMPIFRAVANLLAGRLSIDEFDVYLLGQPFKHKDAALLPPS
jgi:glycerol-3-phosphate dehydrogenase (NAD+)